jgi:hypothetical protein
MTRNQIFWDGNKRTGLMMANKELIAHNAGFLLIDMGNVERFGQLLSAYYDTGDEHELKEFLLSQIRTI